MADVVRRSIFSYVLMDGVNYKKGRERHGIPAVEMKLTSKNYPLKNLHLGLLL